MVQDDRNAREMRRLVVDIPVTEAKDLMALEEEVDGIVRRAAKATKEEMREIAKRMGSLARTHVL